MSDERGTPPDHLTLINPQGLHETPGYHHVTVAQPGRTSYLAGQCPLDEHGDLVGEGDLIAQVDQVVTNALIALAAGGAGPADVVRSVIYVASQRRADLAHAWNRLNQSELAAAFSTASTLLGVTQLGFPGQLVEVDLTAALPPLDLSESG